LASPLICIYNSQAKTVNFTNIQDWYFAIDTLSLPKVNEWKKTEKHLATYLDQHLTPKKFLSAKRLIGGSPVKILIGSAQIIKWISS
jgi:hypothetical protein